MHDIKVAKAGMKRAEQSVDERFQVLGPEGRQAHDAHASVLWGFGREVTSAVRSDLVADFREPGSHFFIIGFDTAVFADYSSAADKCDSQPLSLGCRIPSWRS